MGSVFTGTKAERSKLSEGSVNAGTNVDATHQNDVEAVRRELEEELREETILVEKIERVRNRVNSDGELRDTMRPRSGPADLRNPRLNRDKDAKGTYATETGPIRPQVQQPPAK